MFKNCWIIVSWFGVVLSSSLEVVRDFQVLFFFFFNGLRLEFGELWVSIDMGSCSAG